MTTQLFKRVGAIRLLCLLASFVCAAYYATQTSAQEMPSEFVNDPIGDLIAEATTRAYSEPAPPTRTAKPKPTIAPTPSEAWKARYGPVVISAARQNNVQPNLVMAVIAVESGFNHKARSKDGATGLMQIKYPTARAYGLEVGRGPEALFDPVTNIRVATNYLGAANKIARGNQCAALSRYNRGLGSNSINAAYCAKVAKVLRHTEFALE